MSKSRGEEIMEMELLELVMTRHHLILLNQWIDVLYPGKAKLRPVLN